MVDISIAALIEIAGRVMQVISDTEEGGMSDEPPTDGQTIRLLISPGQAGVIIGRQGAHINELRKSSGANISISNSQHHPCAMPGEEVVSISGDHAAVSAALASVARVAAQRPAGPLGPSGGHMGRGPRMGPRDGGDMYGSPTGAYGMQQDAGHGGHYGGGHRLGGGPGAHRPPHRMGGGNYGSHHGGEPGPPVPLTFRILCSADRVGSIIGLRGRTIQQIRAESGASVSIDPPVEGFTDRVVTISGMDHGSFSSAQDAAQHVANILVTADQKANSMPGSPHHLGAMGGPHGGIQVRLVIPTDDIGGVIGKKGTIIENIRHNTGASVKILAGDQSADDHEHDVTASGAAGLGPQDSLVWVRGAPGSVSNAVGAVLNALRRQARMRAQDNGEAAWPVTQLLEDVPGMGVQIRPGGADVTLEPHVVGAVVGRGGSTINRMRLQSGCTLILQDSLGDGSPQVLEVQGNDPQVLMVVRMIQDVVMSRTQDGNQNHNHNHNQNQNAEGGVEHETADHQVEGAGMHGGHDMQPPQFTDEVVEAPGLSGTMQWDPQSQMWP